MRARVRPEPRPDHRRDLSAPVCQSFPRPAGTPDDEPPLTALPRPSTRARRESAMLEPPSTRSADARPRETGGGVHLNTDKWQLRELEQTQESIAKETEKLAQEVQRLSKSVRESAERVDAIPELLDGTPGPTDRRESARRPTTTAPRGQTPRPKPLTYPQTPTGSNGPTRRPRPRRTRATTRPRRGPPRR